MTTLFEIYKCVDCGNVAEITHGGSCIPECCGKPMVLQKEKTADSATEKHVPLALEGTVGIKVMVGSTPHPMTPEHFIEWIEVINGEWVNRKHLKPGDKPEAQFFLPNQKGLILRSYCNLHGLWRG